jgi:adenylate cyclase, class 2
MTEAGLHNIEFKAKSDRLQEQENTLQQYNPLFAGIDHQVDTYFKVPYGRLKLREGNIENSLIYYERENTEGKKESKIILYEHQPSHELKEILVTTLGVLVIVNKTRRIYFIGNVKFHFDTVTGLGTFVEVEVIDRNGSLKLEDMQQQCDFYASVLGIRQQDYVSCSYSDLLLDGS